MCQSLPGGISIDMENVIHGYIYRCERRASWCGCQCVFYLVKIAKFHKETRNCNIIKKKKKIWLLVCESGYWNTRLALQYLQRGVWVSNCARSLKNVYLHFHMPSMRLKNKIKKTHYLFKITNARMEGSANRREMCWYELRGLSDWQKLKSKSFWVTFM